MDAWANAPMFIRMMELDPQDNVMSNVLVNACPHVLDLTPQLTEPFQPLKELPQKPFKVYKG